MWVFTAMADEYSSVATGKLKLKTDGCVELKKKNKKKKREKDKMKIAAEQAIREKSHEQGQGGRTDGQATSTTGRTLTKAELAFKQQQEKTVSGLWKCSGSMFGLTNLFDLQQKKRILEKASMTHKQRVEKFNQHLDSLTEHYDIPKVSWTK